MIQILINGNVRFEFGAKRVGWVEVASGMRAPIRTQIVRRELALARRFGDKISIK